MEFLLGICFWFGVIALSAIVLTTNKEEQKKMNKQTAEMLRWHGRNHKPLSDKRLTEISEFINEAGNRPASDVMDPVSSVNFWAAAIDLLMEVRRLRKVKK